MIYTWSFVAFTIHVRKGPTLYTILPALPPTAWTSSAHSQDCFAHGTLVAMGLAVWATHGVIFSSAEKISILKKTPKFTACILKGGEKARAWVFSWKYLCWVPTKCFLGKKKKWKWKWPMNVSFWRLFCSIPTKTTGLKKRSLFLFPWDLASKSRLNLAVTHKQESLNKLGSQRTGHSS